MISKLKIDELKNYLRLRDLKVSGTKDELVARVFVTGENNVQPVLAAIEVEDDLRKAYVKKHGIDGKTIPNPMKIPVGWMEEDDGVVFLAYGICPRYISISNVLSFQTSINVKRIAAFRTGGFNHCCIIICLGLLYVL